MKKLVILSACLWGSVCLAQDPSKSVEPPVSVLNEMQPKKASAEYPNIVLIYADDLGYGDLSCYGATKLKTPNIDRLAKEGRLFTDAHSTSAVCTPSRYALLTGEYPLRINKYSPVFCEDSLLINPNQTTIASLLQRKGYATACVGKWHLGFGDKRKPDWNQELKPGPLEVGFDYFFGLPVVNSHPPFVYMENRRIVGLDPSDPLIYKRGGKTHGLDYPEKHAVPPPRMASLIGGKAAHELYVDELIGETLTQKALSWMNQQQQPFFLYYASHNIHHPFTPHPYFQGRSGCGLYGDFVQELDWSVGEILAALDTFGVTDNTLVVFTSDNGGMFNRGGREAIRQGHAPNGKLKGQKFDAWEAGHRVPFLVRWPGKTPVGTASDELIANLDMIATFAALTDQTLSKGQGVDSIDALPLFIETGSKSARNEMIIQPHRREYTSIRLDDWVYIPGPGAGGMTKFKPGQLERMEQKQLYNLKEDPFQRNNLIADYPERADAMAARLEDMLAERGVTSTKSRAKEATVTEGETHRSPAAQSTRTAVPAKQKASMPNVIFMLTDDLGYSDISCYGATKVKTPNIDRLAAEGLRFTDFHTAASICTPSRAAFLCGAYPQRTGSYMGINPNRRAHWFLGLNPDEITIAEQFKKRGYNTCMIGKWHLGTEPEFSMLKQGFDEYAGMPCNYSHSPTFFDGEEETFAKTPLDRLTELYTERVVDFIRRQGETPFFLYYAHNYPHTPYEAGEKFRGSSQDGVRGDIMQEMDWGIGEMMKVLEETGVADNTIVIFTSDNGPTRNEYALPYRGTKFRTLEGGHRVPFILHWPARIEDARVLAVPANAMDLFPTLSDIIAAPMPTDRVYDGVSLVPLLDGKPLARKSNEPFFYYNCENLQAVRFGDWKLHLPRSKDQVPFWDRNKEFLNIAQPVLYDLSADRGETTDVAVKHPEVVQQMQALAEDMRGELGEYLHRGRGQRPTGSAIPGAPVVSHEKDWGKLVDPAMDEAITEERQNRHPDFAAGKKRRKK